MLTAPKHTETRLADVLDWVVGAGTEARFDPPRFHPFPARMPVWLAREIIERTTEPGDVVVDPMVGSGSSAVAALQAGRTFLGADIDPLALLLSRVGVTAVDVARAGRMLDGVRERAEQALASGVRLQRIRAQFDEEGRTFLSYWFPQRSQRELFALAGEIAGLRRRSDRDLAWVVFSTLIIAKSAGASYALDIARSRPHKVEDKPIADPLQAWSRRSSTVLARLPFTAERPPATTAELRRADARDAPAKGPAAKLVITSPPYLNAIDYMRTHKFSLFWMGHPLAALRDLRSSMIGTERGMYSPDSLPDAMEREIVERLEQRRRLGIVRRYLSDMRRVLLQMHATLEPGGAAIMALGPSVIDPAEVDAGDVMGRLAEAVGFRVAGWKFRPLERTRRSLPPPIAMSKGNPLRQRMDGEVFLALVRP